MQGSPGLGLCAWVQAGLELVCSAGPSPERVRGRPGQSYACGSLPVAWGGPVVAATGRSRLCLCSLYRQSSCSPAVCSGVVGQSPGQTGPGPEGTEVPVVGQTGTESLHSPDLPTLLMVFQTEPLLGAEDLEVGVMSQSCQLLQNHHETRDFKVKIPLAHGILIQPSGLRVFPTGKWKERGGGEGWGRGEIEPPR